MTSLVAVAGMGVWTQPLTEKEETKQSGACCRSLCFEARTVWNLSAAWEEEKREGSIAIFGYVHRSTSQAPRLVGQLSHSSVFVVLPCFPFGSHVVSHLTVVSTPCALLSVLRFVTASWLKVKWSIIS